MPKKAEEKVVEKKPVEKVVEKAAEKAPVEKKPAAKKPAVKKTETVVTAVVQIGGQEINVAEIADKALKAYKADHKRKSIAEFKVYVKPEEGVAYYTVNGEGSDDFKVEL